MIRVTTAPLAPAIVIVAVGESYLLASTGQLVAALAFGALAPAGVLWEQARLRERGPVGVAAANLVLGCLGLMQLAILYLVAVDPAGMLSEGLTDWRVRWSLATSRCR